ncbi:hypothetical protein GCM10010272_60360 [Streptomyces lateritius]|nr:hypothetical protein GCM10010272_60360 [Streptomyces lateritius]
MHRGRQGEGFSVDTDLDLVGVSAYENFLGGEYGEAGCPVAAQQFGRARGAVDGDAHQAEFA